MIRHSEVHYTGTGSDFCASTSLTINADFSGTGGTVVTVKSTTSYPCPPGRAPATCSEEVCCFDTVLLYAAPEGNSATVKVTPTGDATAKGTLSWTGYRYTESSFFSLGQEVTPFDFAFNCQVREETLQNLASS